MIAHIPTEREASLASQREVRRVMLDSHHESNRQDPGNESSRINLGLFYPTAVWGVILSAFLALVACVSVRVEPLTHEVYPPQASSESVQWLETEPDSPHIKLARIIATSQSVDEDQMREKILARASAMGADAVVLGKSDVLESVGAGTAPQSTMGPSAGSSGGWWPFYYDRWSFLQGSTDQTGETEYLSGTAIRYVSRK